MSSRLAALPAPPLTECTTHPNRVARKIPSGFVLVYNTKMNIIFAGTPEFAVPTLQALINTPHRLCAVLTQPDRPAGRGRHMTASPVKELAQAHGLTIYQPERLNADMIQTLKEYTPDLMVVVAYGQILPPALLSLPRLGCVNIHASLLPRWRGAAPIQRAILAGDRETGVTLMQMDNGLDTGDMLTQTRSLITPEDTSETLHDRLARLGADCLIDNLAALAQGELTPTKQDDAQATYAKKLTKEEGLIDWQQDAATLARHVHAFNPWPVAYTYLEGERVRIWEAKVSTESPINPGTLPGTIIHSTATGIDILTGKGILKLTKIQMPNRQALPVSQLFHSNAWSPGNTLGTDT